MAEAIVVVLTAPQKEEIPLMWKIKNMLFSSFLNVIFADIVL